MNRDTSLLLVIDVQEKLAASILDIEPLVANAERLIDAATRLGVPICATEHFPARIGPTIKTLKDKLRDDQIVQKVHFSAALEESFQTHLQGLQIQQVIIFGTEAHVCVLQTALALCEQEFDVFLVCDASSSRRASDRKASFQRAAQEGVHLVSTEMVMFEWLKRADVPEFRDILALVKSQS